MAAYFSLILSGYLEWESPILEGEINYLRESLMAAVQMSWRELKLWNGKECSKVK